MTKSIEKYVRPTYKYSLYIMVGLPIFFTENSLFHISKVNGNLSIERHGSIFFIYLLDLCKMSRIDFSLFEYLDLESIN